MVHFLYSRQSSPEACSGHDHLALFSMYLMGFHCESLGNNRHRVDPVVMNPETLRVQICITVTIATTSTASCASHWTSYRVSVHTRRAAPELVRLVMAVIYSKWGHVPGDWLPKWQPKVITSGHRRPLSKPVFMQRLYAAVSSLYVGSGWLAQVRT